VVVTNNSGIGTNTVNLDGTGNATVGQVMLQNSGANAFNATVQNFKPGAANPGIGKLTILAGNGKNSINFLNSSASVASILVNSTTGQNTIAVSNDQIVGNASLGGLSINVGATGSTALNSLTVTNVNTTALTLNNKSDGPQVTAAPFAVL